MLSVWMILAAIGVLGLSGLPACLLSSRSAAGQRADGAAAWCSAACWDWAASRRRSARRRRPSLARAVVPALGPVRRDARRPQRLSSWRRSSWCRRSGAIYGLGYWKQSEHPDNGRRLGLFYGLLAGSMALVVIARDGVLFLIAWEVMALAAYFAATAEDDNPEVRRAGWVYLIATHVGTLCLIAMFALWRHATGFVRAGRRRRRCRRRWPGRIFVLALIGFGFKAGLMPLHVWLPGAHANAPSHVSAVMSGVMLKMGVYGIVRMTALLPAPAAWWGGVLLAVGAITGRGGHRLRHRPARPQAAAGLQQHREHRHHRHGPGPGAARPRRWAGRTGCCWDWAAPCCTSGTTPVQVAAVPQRRRGHPRGRTPARSTGWAGWPSGCRGPPALFLVGAVAICGLPPLNGFVSEWLLYLGLFRTLGSGGEPRLCRRRPWRRSALAMIGALAVACFVKVFGTVFLGDAAQRAPPSTRTTRRAACSRPWRVLAVGCVVHRACSR